MMKIIKRMVLLSLFIAVAAAINGCSTVKGFGKDVSKAGHGIEKVAN